jgi:ketosteroid isomerase-like protein
MSSVSTSENDPVAHSHQCHLAAAKTGDLNAIASLFCDNSVLMAPNDTTLYGCSEVREWFEEYYEHFRIVALEETEREVTIVSDEWVLERFAYTVAIEPLKGGGESGDRIRDDGRWFAAWKREADGKWKMFQAMFNSTRPIGSGTSRFIARMSQRRTRA